MSRRYNFELKQEGHSFQEKRSSLGYKNYYVPPPTIQKIDNHPPFHYESSDVEEDDDDNHHHVAAVNNNRRLIQHDFNHNRDNWSGTHHANNHADVKNKQQGGKLLRPPIHQYRHPVGIIGHQGKETSRTNYNNRNDTMEDYPRKYFPNYGHEVSRVEDEYDNNEVRDQELEYPLIMKGIIHGGNRVKKIEVIEYERRTLRGARQEWVVLGGNGAIYPNSHAPWVKGF